MLFYLALAISAGQALFEFTSYADAVALYGHHYSDEALPGEYDNVPGDLR